MSGDMQTMPIRELIASLRVQVTELPPADIIKLLFIQVMINRLEEQANLADKYKGRYLLARKLLSRKHEPILVPTKSD